METLNQNELEALRILWQGRELKPAEIAAQFGWEIENATLRSVLVNLVAKGHVARRMQGKAFFYSARVPKATLLQNFVRTMARVFAGGSDRDLVMQLLETSDVKAEDLKLLRKTASENAPEKSKRRGK